MSEILDNPEKLLQAELKMQEGFEEWLSGHIDDVIGELPYDRNRYPFQKIDINQYGPIEPSLEYARLGGTALMGESFDNFLNDLQRCIPIIKSRLSESRSILIATPHIPDVLDTPLVAAAIFCASDEPALAESTIINSGKLMSRVTFFGESGVEAMSRIGEVDTSIPRSATAQKTMETELIDYINKSMLHNFVRKVRQGRLVHQAPSNTRAISTPNGLLITRVNEETTKLITRLIGYGIPISVRRAGNEKPAGWRIGKPRELKSSEDVHRMMEEITEVSSDLFGGVRYESEREAKSRLGAVALNTL